MATARVDSGEPSLKVLGRADKGFEDAYLVHASGERAAFTTQWIHRDGSSWHRDTGPESHELGTVVCEGRDAEIAVPDPRSGRYTPPSGSSTPPAWYALVKRERGAELRWASPEGKPVVDGGEEGEARRLVLLVRGVSGIKEGPLVTARSNCTELANGAPWDAMDPRCFLSFIDERFGLESYTLTTEPSTSLFAYGASGSAPQLALTLTQNDPPSRSGRQTLLIGPPQVIQKLRFLFAGDLDGDRRLDLVLEAPREEALEKRRVHLFVSSNVRSEAERVVEVATYDVPNL